MDIEKVQLYFSRLALTVPETIIPDAALLRTLHRAHCLRIPFENTQYLNKTLIPVEPDALFRHIVLERHGGLCLDLNGCFLRLLTALGYSVSSLSVSIVGELQMDFPHRVLLATDCTGTQWWCDVADTLTMLTEPLLFVPDTVQHSNGETLRFKKTDSGLRLECLRAGQWIGRYLYENQVMSDGEAFRYKAGLFAVMMDKNDVFSAPFFLLKTERGGRMLSRGHYREITDGESFTREYSDGELPELCKLFFP